MAYAKYERVTVDCAKVRPHVQELVYRCGTAQVASEYAQVGHSTISRILHGYHCTIQQATARKILVALDRKRAEDRKLHAVHERFIEARNNQKRIEDAQERLVGY